MSNKHFGAAISAALMLGTAQGVSVTSYATQADYDAAAGPTVIDINFDGLPGGSNTGIFAGEIDFNTPDGSNPANIILGSDALTDAGSRVTPNSVGSIEGVFARSVTAFAFDILSGEGGMHTLAIYGEGDVLLDTILTPQNGFVGVTVDMVVTRFVLTGATFASTGGQDRVFIDNFVASEVPLPGALGLFAAGSALFAIRRRRLAS